MAEFQFTKLANVTKLQKEILASSFSSKYGSITSKGDQVRVVTKTDLAASEVSELNAIINNHTVKDDEAVKLDSAARSIRFAISLFSELSVYFSNRGLTDDEMELVSERFSKFQQLIYGGFFRAAQSHLAKIPTDALVPTQVISQINKRISEQINRTLKE